MSIYFYLDGINFSFKTAKDFGGVIPRQNDLIRFNGLVCKIKDVVFIADKEPHYVAIDIVIETKT